MATAVAIMSIFTDKPNIGKALLIVVSAAALQLSSLQLSSLHPGFSQVVLTKIYIYRKLPLLPSSATSNAIATKFGPPKWLLLEFPLHEQETYVNKICNLSSLV